MKKEVPINCEHCTSLAKGTFCFLKIAEIENIEHRKVFITYKKGQTLFVQGNHPYGFYCISKGNVKLTKQGSEGKESILRIAQAGDIVGHKNLLTEDKYSWTATVLEDTDVCFIEKKFLINIIQNNSFVALNIINKLSVDMKNAYNKFTSLHQKNVRERLAELLLALTTSHGIQEEKCIRINLKLSREEMATIIGTANETLIRFLTEFKEAGILEQKGKVLYIKDEEKLINWANSNF